MTTLFEHAGGEPVLRAVIRTFYDAVFADLMIGFFFRGADEERLIEKEYELTARALGAKHVRYTGKPLREIHAKHPILGGHFERRLQILREAMDAHGLPENVKQAWVEHTRSLRPLVTDDAGSECDHDAALERMRRLSEE